MKPLSSLGYASVLLAAPLRAQSTPLKLDVPPAPPAGAKTVDPALISYSLEFANFHDFTGNASHPNKLSARMLQNLADITGAYPEIRIGGTTANHAAFVASQAEPIVLNFTTPGADQPSSLTWGPAWVDLFKNLPAGIKYTVGLSFNSGDAGTAATVDEAVELYRKLNSSLYGFEVGNEFDAFPVDRNRTTWNIKEFTREWLDRIRDVSTAINGAGSNKTGPFFQTGTFTAPRSFQNITGWNFSALVEDGILQSGNVRSYSGHQYFGAACSPVKPTIDSLFNQTVMDSYMKLHAEESSLAVKLGVEYNIGETNSIACQGQANVSDVFASALWAIDYSLYAASLNVSRLYFHSGVGYRYASWQPRQNGTTAPGPRPLYYGQLFVADAIRGGKQVRRLQSAAKAVIAYGIYGASSAQLEHVAVVNMNQYRDNSGGPRPSVTVQLGLDASSPAAARGQAKVRRLTAPSITAKEGIAWAGKTLLVDGTVDGQDVATELQNGTVEVPASEAVLISFGV